jgi:hypothetical protein
MDIWTRAGIGIPKYRKYREIPKFGIPKSRKFQYRNFQYYRIPKISIPKFSILPNPENLNPEIQNSQLIFGIIPEIPKILKSATFSTKISKKKFLKRIQIFFFKFSGFSGNFWYLGSRISVFPGIFGISYRTFNNEKKKLEIFF